MESFCLYTGSVIPSNYKVFKWRGQTLKKIFEKMKNNSGITGIITVELINLIADNRLIFGCS